MHEPPPPARPVGIFVKCIAQHADGTYDATFGYDNPNPATVEIPVGLANGFSPDPQARGQTTLFAPGDTQEAFVVSGTPRATTLVWTLAYQGTRTASASWYSPTKCSDVTPPPPGSVGVFLACVTTQGHRYSATFGYENPGSRTLRIAIGPRNGFEPAPVDRGQPSEFEPGNVQKAFTLAGMARSSRPTWTVVGPDGGSSVAAADPGARDCVTDPPPPAPEPELRIQKTADTSVAVVGQPIRYRLTVRNIGTGSALAVRLTDRLPHGLNLRSVEVGRLACTRGAAVSCTRGATASRAERHVLPHRRADAGRHPDQCRCCRCRRGCGRRLRGGGREGPPRTSAHSPSGIHRLNRAAGALRGPAE